MLALHKSMQDPYKACICSNELTSALQSHESGAKPLVLSTSRGEVKLWEVASFRQEPIVFDSCRGACFDPFGRLVAATHSRHASATIFDISARMNVLSIEDEKGLQECCPPPAHLTSRSNLMGADVAIDWQGLCSMSSVSQARESLQTMFQMT